MRKNFILSKVAGKMILATCALCLAFTSCSSDELIDTTNPTENTLRSTAAPDHTIQADASKLSFSSTHTLYANNSGGATLYKWTLMGNATFADGSRTATSTTNQIKINTGSNDDPNMGQLLRVSCEATNQYGSTTKSVNLMFR